MTINGIVTIICIIELISSPLVTASSVLSANLKFKLSARNLVDKDGFTTTDGYVEVYYSNDGGRIIRKLGRTETVFDKRNPDWINVFEFQFDRKLNQYWYFHIYDEDHLAFDETVGRVWVNVADYVDKNQVVHANLDNSGYLSIRSKDKSIQKSAKNTVSFLPFKRDTPNSKRIRFKVTSRGLEKNINNYETLTVSVAEGVNGAEKFLGKSTLVTGRTNPGWDQVFSLDWNKKKDQRFHFKVFDGSSSQFKEKDKIAEGWIQANDYISKGESFTVLLVPKGTLTMKKV